MTLDTIANCAFGIESSCVNDRGNEFMEMGRKAFSNASKPPLGLRLIFLAKSKTLVSCSLRAPKQFGALPVCPRVLLYIAPVPTPCREDHFELFYFFWRSSKYQTKRFARSYF